ncbi:MAG: hypothetical protein A2W33_04205 [Chloroflexi bacterium RBG_16_52_11]|nr:MAG: hypothetical protein A2W33_04205 [Chloroflexi bacterium RBG_16_52_11]
MARLIDWINNPQVNSSGRSDKRTRKVKQPVSSHRQKLEPKSQPPVMVRGSMASIPLQKRRVSKSKARKRYDLTLNVPGAEMRLPSLPMVSIGPRLLSGVLVVGLIVMLYFLWTSPLFQVGEVELNGLQRLSSLDVNTVLDVSGERIFTLNPGQLEKKLIEAFPEFSSVSVKIVFPSQVLATVEERSPILAWKQDGRTQLIDANGVAFPQRTLAEITPAIVVEASSSPPGAVETTENVNVESGMPTATQLLPVEMVSGIISMSAVAPQNTPLVFDKEHGLGWKDTQGWDVFFGDIRDIDSKLRIYQALIMQLAKEKVNPVLISVEYLHTPYYRLEQ